MTDTLSPTQRSERMALVRGKDTVPELIVRRLVHGMGFRYRLHGKGLPGRPDLVFPRLRKVIFVHGCFWHRHDTPGCRLSRLPKSNEGFWLPKLEANHLRDSRNLATLHASGWSTLVVWECQLKDKEQLANKIREYLGGENAGDRTFRGGRGARNRG